MVKMPWLYGDVNGTQVRASLRLAVRALNALGADVAFHEFYGEVRAGLPGVHGIYDLHMIGEPLSEYLLLCVYLPVELPKDRIHGMMQAVHLANCTVPEGNWMVNLSPAKNSIVYRTTLSFAGSVLSDETVSSWLKGTIDCLNEWMKIWMPLADGTMTPEQLVARADDEALNSRSDLTAVPPDVAAVNVFDRMCQAAEEHGWSYSREAEAMQADFHGIMPDGSPVWTVFGVNTDLSMAYVQGIFPFTVPTERQKDFSLAVNEANRILLRGSFDFYQSKGLLSFRMTQRYAGGLWTEQPFGQMMDLLSSAFLRYGEIFGALAAGKGNISELMERIRLLFDEAE